MPSELHIRDGAAWRKATEMHFRDGSAWRKAQEVFVHDGTAWRKVFTAGVVSTSWYGGDAYHEAVTTSTATLTFASNGNVDFDQNAGAKWFDPPDANIGNSYWIRATGDAGAGPALNTWHALSTSRSWAVTRSAVGSTSRNLTIQIASDSAGTTIVASGSVTVTAAVIT